MAFGKYLKAMVSLCQARGPKASYDFTVSNVTAQVRYRWEIAPLTDFYLVYNLANALPDQINADFNALFDETFREPTISRLVAKLR